MNTEDAANLAKLLDVISIAATIGQQAMTEQRDVTDAELQSVAAKLTGEIAATQAKVDAMPG
jgi:hypothetical protein